MGQRTRDAEAELNLPPGFRFHPTDDELVVHYLLRKIGSQRLPVPIIAEIDLYKFDPWELPQKALFGQREWYFFTPRDRKYPNGSRPNRAAGRGYWKATGADKPVLPKGYSRPLGIKKALVFYAGKAPKGVKSDWIMHEYRLADTSRASNKKGTLRLDDWVLCRLYNKKNSWEKMQQQQQQRQQKESAFSTETMDSFDDSLSEGFRTLESDIENDVFSEFEDLRKPGAYLSKVSTGAQSIGAQPTSISNGVQAMEQRQKEESDWFMDLNLDDLQGSFGGFGSTPDFGTSIQDYYFPTLGSSQMNLPPF